jgi:hypothetical protein
MKNMANVDLKHWGGRRGVDGPYEIDYEMFAYQASRKLGKGGVVGIPNARGPDDPLGAEYRFEELSKLAEHSCHPITSLGDGRVFHDDKYGIWFAKSQEINTILNGAKLTYLVFGSSMDENFNEQGIEAIHNKDLIKVLTAPSCTRVLDSLDRQFLGNFNGVIVHSSSAAVLPGANKASQKFYDGYVNRIRFKDSFNQEHWIGEIAVSGGHRSPKENLLQRIVSPISVGSSSTYFLEFEGESLSDFYQWLKKSIEYSGKSSLVKGSAIREELFGHLPRMVQGVLIGERKSIF